MRPTQKTGADTFRQELDGLFRENYELTSAQKIGHLARKLEHPRGSANFSADLAPTLNQADSVTYDTLLTAETAAVDHE